MQELGQFLLLVTFFVTLSTALLAIAGALTRQGAMMRASRYGLYASALLYVAMALILSHGFLTHDFSNKYIATYSDRSMPTVYLSWQPFGEERRERFYFGRQRSPSSVRSRSTRDVSANRSTSRGPSPP